MDKIRVGIVNYLNTRPLLKGLNQLALNGEIHLIQDYPARIADDLIAGRVDIGLVPVAVLPHLSQASIIGSHCIATEGSVASVCLFSEQPLESLDTILLDYQSRTSVQLLQILLRDYWKKEVKFIPSHTSAYIDQIQGRSGGLIIGDRALNAYDRFNYKYDLGEAWLQLTGMPFVFAVWVSRIALEERFIEKFNQANELGLSAKEEIALENAGAVSYNLYHYFTNNIDYYFTERKRMALDHFLTYSSTLPPLFPSSESKNI